jgi:hypothetical protein
VTITSTIHLNKNMKESPMMIEPTAATHIQDNVVEGRIVLIDPSPEGMNITIGDDHGQTVIVRLNLRDCQSVRHFTNGIEECSDELATMTQEERIAITPYGVDFLAKHLF